MGIQKWVRPNLPAVCFSICCLGGIVQCFACGECIWAGVGLGAGFIMGDAVNFLIEQYWHA